MNCPLCKSVGASRNTCPNNPSAKKKDYTNHPLSMKQQAYVTFLDQYIVPMPGTYTEMTLDTKPFIWIFDFKDSSIANADSTYRWDTDTDINPLILWYTRNNRNQTSFTIDTRGSLCVFGQFHLTFKNNQVVRSNQTDVHLKIRPAFPPLPHPTSSHLTNTGIKFVAYNILTARTEFEDELLYVEPALRRWGSGREKLVRTEILKADIAVLVECTSHQLRDILQGAGENKFETHIKFKINELDGTAILFDKSRFHLLKKQGQRLTKEGGQIVFNVALVDLYTHKKLCVTGLHLKSGDLRKDEIRRIKELESALKITASFINEYEHIAQVLSGDLNSDFKTFNHAIPMTVTAKLTHVDNGYARIGDNRPTYWNFQQSVYDYIYINGPLKATSYDVDVIDVHTRCPNAKQGSDHLAIRCNLIL